jgi:plastocyanin
MKIATTVGVAAAAALNCWTTIGPARAQDRAPAVGAIEGRITFEGATPPPTIVIEGGSTQHVLHVDKAGGLRYVVAYLPDSSREGVPPPGIEAVVNQRSFIFEPQVLVVLAGESVRFTNEDPANHNVRSQAAEAANTFSIYTGTGEVGSRRFVVTPPDRPIVLSCDIHPWMAAWMYVFNHSHFAVTDAAGRFRIDHVSPGRHRLAIRHPGGRLARNVILQVIAGQTTREDVRFTSSDLDAPAR